MLAVSFLFSKLNTLWVSLFGSISPDFWSDNSIVNYSEGGSNYDHGFISKRQTPFTLLSEDEAEILASYANGGLTQRNISTPVLHVYGSEPRGLSTENVILGEASIDFLAFQVIYLYIGLIKSSVASLYLSEVIYE